MKISLLFACILVKADDDASRSRVKESKHIHERLIVYPPGCTFDEGLRLIGDYMKHRVYTVYLKNSSRCKLVLMAAVPYTGRWLDPSAKEEKDAEKKKVVKRTKLKSYYNPPKEIKPGECATFALVSTEFAVAAQGWIRYRCDEDNTAIHIHLLNPPGDRGFCKVRALAYDVYHRDHRLDSFQSNHHCMLNVFDQRKPAALYADDDTNYMCRCPSPTKFFYRDNHFSRGANDSFSYTIASHYRIV